MPTTTFAWLVNGESYATVLSPDACPECGARYTLAKLPPPLAAKQPDGTTHVCHPSFGGCNHGFRFNPET